MKFTLAIFALLSASVSSMKVDTTVDTTAEVQSLTSIDMMMLANAEEEEMLEKMTPA